MKAIIVQHGRLRIDDVPCPEPGPYQCLVKTLYAATCNETDRRFIERSAEKPLVLGHESVGHVVEVGGRVRNFNEGDFCLRPTAVYPGQTLGDVGCGLGGFSEFGLVTDVAAAEEDGTELPPAVAAYSRYQQIVPNTIDPKDATMMVTLKETLSWSQRAGVGKDRGVLIFGDGPVGQSFVKMAALLGANPIVLVGHWPQRLERAKKLGAHKTLNRKEKPVAESCPDRMADVVIDAVGKYELIQEAFPLMREHAMYTVYGMTADRHVSFEMGTGPRQWRLVFMKMDEAETHQQIVDWIVSGKLDPSLFYDRVMPAARAAEAFELLAARKANKIVLDFGSP
jgi:threonine dehydrogenase-like Zn-dependent dehydrogenase